MKSYSLSCIALVVIVSCASERAREQTRYLVQDGWIDPARAVEALPDGTRGIPFVDRDGDCRVPDRRIKIHRLDRRGPIGTASGVLVTVEGKVPVDGRAPRLDRRVCVAGTDTCSAEMRLPFAGEMPMVEALWLCTDRPEDHLRGVILELEDGERVEVEPRPHMGMELRGDGRQLTVTTTLPIDRYLARLVRRDGGRIVATLWSSIAGGGWTVDGPTNATLRIPSDALTSCSECAVIVQLAHVWRDDEVHDVSEAERTIELGGDGA